MTNRTLTTLRRRLAREARRVGRTPARKDLTLHLLDLPFEPLDALIGSRRLALRECGGRHEHRREAKESQ